MPTHVEIEYKFLVTDREKLISILQSLGKLVLPRQYQRDVMYDNPASLMHKTNGTIRVCTLGETGNKKFAYKKHEIEHDVPVADEDNKLEKILEVMQFKPVSSYERYRTQWRIKKTHVVIDEYPFAMFVQIKGKLKDCKRIVDEFDLNISSALTKPADTLFQEWRSKHNLPFKPHMSFLDFDK